MMKDERFQQALAMNAMGRDFTYATRFTYSLARHGDSRLAPVATNGILAYFSLFVHEGMRWIKMQGADLTELADARYLGRIADSRHSLKFFENTAHGSDFGLLTYMRRLRAAHEKEFLGTNRSVWTAFRKDMGLALFDGHLIATSHGMNMLMGIDPDQIFQYEKADFTEPAQIYTEFMSSACRAWDLEMDTPSFSFLDAVDDGLMSERNRRSSRVYANAFPGVSDPDVTALLTVLLSMLNFLRFVLRQDRTDASRQTIVKMEYLTVYTVLRSLQKICRDMESVVTRDALEKLQAIGNSDIATDLCGDDKRPFRNTLMHYGVDSRIALDVLRLDVPLYGLVDACFPGHDFFSFESQLYEELFRIADALEAWAAIKE